jgi:hypothetical protein
MVDILGYVLTGLVFYWLIGATVFLVWPHSWPLRQLAAYVWPATLLLLAADRVYEAVFGGER